jgi:hypothetical protein
MFLIYDNILKRNVWITEFEQDVTQFNWDYTLEIWTPEWQADFDAYKLENSTPSDEPEPEPVVEVILTDVQKKELERQTAAEQSVFLSFAFSVYNSYKDFWFNPVLTPQERCDAKWVKAYELFEKHQKWVQLVFENIPNILEFIPDFMDVTHLPDGKAATINEDWSVTISIIPIE